MASGLINRWGRSRPLEDIGEIAVLQDEGDLVQRPTRSTSTTSDSLDAQRRRRLRRPQDRRDVPPDLGSRLVLEDDDSEPAGLRFAFNFYGRSHSQAFVNSDGNVTFGEDDRASTERNITRVLTGPPRIAPFFADLDPTTGSGQRVRSAAADQFTVTWCNVRGFESQRTTTRAGDAAAGRRDRNEVRRQHQPADAIVGALARTNRRLRADRPERRRPDERRRGGRRRALRQAGQLDTSAVAQKFYRTHPDSYDQLVLWTDTRSSATPSRSRTTSPTRSAASARRSSISRATSAARAPPVDGDHGLVSASTRRIRSRRYRRRELHAERAGPGSRPPVARVSQLPRP